MFSKLLRFIENSIKQRFSKNSGNSRKCNKDFDKHPMISITLQVSRKDVLDKDCSRKILKDFENSKVLENYFLETLTVFEKCELNFLISTN